MNHVTNAHVDAANTLTTIRDDELRAGLGQLFATTQDLIDRGEVTLVVLTARRLACLYRALVAVGMPPLTGCPVVSDRYLETRPDRDWTAEKILVLDDSVVVGTTLDALTRRLESLVGTGQVSARAVCVDAEQHVPFLTEKLGLDALPRSTAQVDAFAEDIVRTLFRHQIPYFSDFPVTRRLAVPDDAWTALRDHDGWHFVDVSHPLVADQTHTAHSIVLDVNALAGRMAGPIANLVEHAKCRVYARETPEGRQVTLVPLALLKPCALGHVDRALAALEAAHPVIAQLRAAGWTPEARQRLLQMIASVQVLQVVWDQLVAVDAATDPLDAEALAPLPLVTYFSELFPTFSAVVNAVLASPDAGETLSAPAAGLEPGPSRLLSHVEVRRTLWGSREVLPHLRFDPDSPAFSLNDQQALFRHAVLEAFGHVHQTLERSERQRIAEYGTRDEYLEAFPDPDSRILHHGLSSGELVRALNPQGWDSIGGPLTHVLLAIDVGNDLGIIVPTTRTDRDRQIVYRTYRLGETAGLVDTPLWQLAEGRPSDADAFLTTAKVEEAAVRVGQHALPGEVISRHDGVVLDVGPTHFSASLTDPLLETDVPAELFLDQVDDADRPALVPGRRFVWTMFQHDGVGRTRSSRIRLLPEGEGFASTTTTGAATE